MPYLQKVAQPSNRKMAVEPRPLSPLVERTVEAWVHLARPSDDASVPKVEVHGTVSNVAWAYEKLRQAIDYQDEHLLRKNAIHRILKRRLVAGANAKDIAEPLVVELIRGRYLPNNAVPTTQIDETENIINRYIYLWASVPTLDDQKESERLFDWYLDLVSVQLNELFSPPARDELLLELMHHIADRDVSVASTEMDEPTKATQLYIAIHRSLLKSDTAIMRYHLFTRNHPEWVSADIDTITVLGEHLPEIRTRIEQSLLHPAGELLQRLMKKYVIIFQVLNDIVVKHGEGSAALLTQPEELIKEIKAAYSHRRKTVTGRIVRSVVRSIIYVFLTKMILTLLIEVPLDRLFFSHNLNYLPLVINTSFPPLLLLFIGISIRPPGKKNEEAVIEKVQDLVYRADERYSVFKPRKPIRRSSVFTFFYRIFYALTFVLVFGGIIALLTRFEFSPVSTFIFILFLTIVSFFGIRVRLLSRELLVVDQRENIFTVLFDFFTVPILQVGRWISLRAPKINVLIFFLDVIIEAPFKAFLDATEGFFGFLREKREEIY